MKTQIFELSEEKYQELFEDGGGFCLACGMESELPIEPDANKYECTYCKEYELYGIEELLLMGNIVFTD